MITTKEDMLFYIKEDKKRNLGAYKIGTINFLFQLIYGTDGMKVFRLLKALRKYEYATNTLRHKNLFGKMVCYLRHYKFHKLSERYDIQIETNMVGYGFNIPHVVGGGIIINCQSMGNYCCVNVGVVIGTKEPGGKAPVIGDNVAIGMGAKVFGPIHIGDNSRVAPNSVVFKDVPENTIVSGIPAMIIKQNGISVKKEL